MALSIVHCRTASIHDGLLTTWKRAWCSPKYRRSTKRSSKAATCSFCRPSITRPTVSYKGGDPGFIRVIDNKTVAFPWYDGNGMFYSMGNLLGNRHVGLLFINFEKPHRLRLQGVASVDDNDPLLSEYAEAQLVVRVLVTEIFRNCPRYVHHYKKTDPSEFVPRSTCETPFAPWKRIDDMQTVLPAKDRARVEREGILISREEYEKYIADVSGRES
jgi:predicted pyridoxine 5'-phosphate oxidase superfamily flavin-nucleotide-binding protein